MGADALRLTKHHGAGNDFLVLLDDSGALSVDPSEAAALCHRHFGVGADGILCATRPGGEADLSMELKNADGTSAEMSGNGIRCLVQAAVTAGWVRPGQVVVDTAAGRRSVEYRHGPAPAEGFARVDMGLAVLGPELVLDGIAYRAGRAVDMGNPHRVILVDGPVDEAVFGESGPRLGQSVPGGANVEFVWPLGAGVLAMRVWERGVGETLACGTGACAVAVAAEAWGLGTASFAVRSPGGTLEVEITDDGVVLGGPTVQVATVEVDRVVLSALVEQLRRGQRLEHEVAAGL